MKFIKLLLLAGALCAAAASGLQAATLTVAWDPVPGAAGYKVERAIVTSPTVINFIEIQANVTGTTYTDTSAAAGLNQYRVRAFNGAVLSDYSNIAGWLPFPTNVKVTGPSPIASVQMQNGDQFTLKASTNPTRPGSKTINVPPGGALFAENTSQK